MIIYIVTNRINGKQYVGQTIQRFSQRKVDHLKKVRYNSPYYFHNAMRKHGPDNFKWEIIAEGDCSPETLNLLEMHFIQLYDTFNNGYNLTLGGDGGTLGYRHTEKTKKRMSKAKEGKYFGKDNPYYGKKHSEEICKKMRGPRPSIRGNKHPNSKCYIITTPENKEIYVDCLSIFIEQQGDIGFKRLYNVATGKRKQYKGYKCRYAD